MTNQDIANQFRTFGYKIIPIAILALFSILFVIINFINAGTNWIFYFGFWLVLGIVFQIIISIFFFFILGNIKNVAYNFNQSDLERFPNKIITISILRIIGYLLYILCVPVLILFYSEEKYTITRIYRFVYALFGFFGAMILLFIAAIIEIQAWKILKENFSINIKNNNAKTGAMLCMVGAILDATTILRFISYILKTIGYFLLVFSLRDLTEENIAPISSPYYQQKQTPAIPIAPAAPMQPNIRYCPNCGSNLKGTEKFCPRCGTNLRI